MSQYARRVEYWETATMCLGTTPVRRPRALNTRLICIDLRAGFSKGELGASGLRSSPQAHGCRLPVLDTARILAHLLAREVPLVDGATRLEHAVACSVGELREAVAEHGAPDTSCSAEAEVRISGNS